jgi:hypothetical protein
MNLIEKELTKIAEEFSKEKPDLNLESKIALPRNYTLIIKQPSYEFCFMAYNEVEKLFFKDKGFADNIMSLLSQDSVVKIINDIINDESTVLKSPDGAQEPCNMAKLYTKNLVGNWLIVKIHIIKIVIAPFISTLFSQMSRQEKLGDISTDELSATK